MKQGNPVWFQVVISSDDCTQTSDRKSISFCNTSFMKVNASESLQKQRGVCVDFKKEKKEEISSRLDVIVIVVSHT